MKARTYRKLVEKKNQELALLAAGAPASPPVPAAPAATGADQYRVAAAAVEAILADLPQLLAVAVVDATSGMSLASHSNSPSINPDTAAAYNTEVVKQKQKAMAALKLQGETIEDILITLTHQLHLLKLNAAGTKFIYLVVNMRDTNLAIAREVLRANAECLD